MTDAKSQTAESKPVNCDSSVAHLELRALFLSEHQHLSIYYAALHAAVEGTDDKLPSAKHVNTYSAETEQCFLLYRHIRLMLCYLFTTVASMLKSSC